MKSNRFYPHASHAMYTNPTPKIVAAPYRPNVKGVPPPPSMIFNINPPTAHRALRASSLTSR
jgi:hypothetical protein